MFTNYRINSFSTVSIPTVFLPLISLPLPLISRFIRNFFYLFHLIVCSSVLFSMLFLFVRLTFVVKFKMNSKCFKSV